MSLKRQIVTLFLSFNALFHLSNQTKTDSVEVMISLSRFLCLKHVSIAEDNTEKKVNIVKMFSKNDQIVKIMKGYIDNDNLIARFIEDDIETYKTVRKGVLIFDDFITLEEAAKKLKPHINQEVYFLDSTSLNLYETFQINNISTFAKLGHLNKSLEQFVWGNDVNQK